MAPPRWPKPALPARYVPELATLTREPPSGDEWLHEIKFDGYRFGCRIERGTVKLISRNGHDWTGRLPHIARAASKLKAKEALLDGEVAVVLPDGKTSFSGLQDALGHGSGAARQRIEPVYFLFDLLFLDGNDTAKGFTQDRKATLKQLLSGVAPDGLLKFSDHVMGHGAAFFENAKRLGLEGIVSKRANAPYRPGRSADWLKTKAAHRQEFVICGYVLRDGSKEEVGSLILGVRSQAGPRGAWVYCGQVGTGFTQAVAAELFELLQGKGASGHPFLAEPKLDTHRWGRRKTPAVPRWTRPSIVCEVAFAEWTPDGTLRHPSFRGLRDDKEPAEVVREGY